MATSAGLQSGDAHYTSAVAPTDGGDALHGALAAAGAPRPHERATFSSLPHALVVRVLAALPVDARLRCAEVCKAWREAVCDRSLWLRVELSAESGMTRAVTSALLRAVAARAAGYMHTLVLTLESGEDFVDALVDVLQANSASLRELRTGKRGFKSFNVAELERMLRAAPQLTVLQTNVCCSLDEAVRILRRKAPFGPFCAGLVIVEQPRFAAAGADDEEIEDEVVELDPVDDDELLELAAAMGQHPSLVDLVLRNLPLDTPEVLDAFVDVVLAHRTEFVCFDCCSLDPDNAPALARLLSSAALTHLAVDSGDDEIDVQGQQLLDAPAALLLADALQTNTTLIALRLNCCFLWEDPDAGIALLAALTAHPSLQVLHLNDNLVHDDDVAAVGDALGALIAANAPALRELRLPRASLGDALLAPLIEALPGNTHLRLLQCGFNFMSVTFARDRFLPAVRANASLRVLEARYLAYGVYGEYVPAPDEVAEAEAIVEARADADATPYEAVKYY